MPSVIIGIPSREISITRSVSRDIIKDLILATGFPLEAEIVLEETQGGPRALTGPATPCDDVLRTPHGNYIFARYQEYFTEKGMALDRPFINKHKPIFSNGAIGLEVFPVYEEVEVEMVIRWRTRDLTVMNNWLSSMRVSQGIRSLVKYHNAKYDYTLPNAIVEFIIDSYKMTELVMPYGDTLKAYISKHFINKPSRRKNISGSHVQPIFHEIQTGIVGMSSDKQVYNTKEAEGGIYELEMPYKFAYKQIAAVYMTFPIIIHNTFIPNKYITTWDQVMRVREETGFKPIGWIPNDLDNGLFDKFYKGDGGTRLIEYDNFFPATARKDELTILLTPIQVAPEDPTGLFSLFEIDDTILPGSVKEALRLNIGTPGLYRDSLITVELYEIGVVETRLECEMDGDLLRTKAPMNARARNYLKISLAKDFSLLTPDVTTALLKEGAALGDLCKLLDPSVVVGNDGQADLNLDVNGAMDEQDYLRWLKRQKTVNEAYRKSPDHNRRYVATLNQISRRK